MQKTNRITPFQGLYLIDDFYRTALPYANDVGFSTLVILKKAESLWAIAWGIALRTKIKNFTLIIKKEGKKRK
jgi:hypothetical protein